MKITVVGPGIMPIPPKGWGALEILIWDFKQFMEKEGSTVEIINTPNVSEIIQRVNAIDSDVVHIHYDVFWNIVPYLKCKNICLTSQYGFLEQKSQWFQGYFPIFNGFVQLSQEKKVSIHCVSEGIKDIYQSHGVPSDRLFVIPNGANELNYQYRSTALYPSKSIYLGKIEPRKRQSLYQEIPTIDFVGGWMDQAFHSKRSNYLGEWSKEQLYQHLTDYANLVLISEAECHALVIAEALICGLGVVVSEEAAAHLDRSLPFIDVIPNDRIRDQTYVQEIIEKNRTISITMRDEIRAYGLRLFSWSNVIQQYRDMYNSILQQA